MDSNPRCAILTRCKQENNYVREWVIHHLNFGFDKIYILDNNDIGGERLGDVIGDYIINDKVKLLDVRGQEFIQQNQMLIEAFISIQQDWDWLAIIDVDEFIMSNEFKSIKDLVQSDKYKDFNCICLNWHQMYGHIVERKDLIDGSLIKSFLDFEPVNTAKKIFKIEQNIIVNTAHGPVCKGRDNVNLLCCDADGTFDDNVKYTNDTTKIADQHSWINHYRKKTMEDFLYDRLDKWWSWRKVKFQFTRGFDDLTEHEINYIRDFYKNAKYVDNENYREFKDWFDSHYPQKDQDN